VPEEKQVKTIKVGEDAIGSDKCHYALVMDRKVTAVGTKEEMLAQCKEQGGRVWVSTKQVGDLVEGSESWEAGYKRRVVKTTSKEHKAKGYNWRIKGKDRPEISIKLYKEKPSQQEFNKQMKRVAGHEFGG
jgi:hypothetical protein